MLKHLAIIADGNRRWAKQKKYSLNIGYSQGLKTIEQCCEWAINNNIQYLTFYCFSTENWDRPKEEIDIIMDIGNLYFLSRLDWYMLKNIKIQFVGRKNKIKSQLIQKCNIVEAKTANNTKLILTICLDYGGRNEIIQAIESGARTEEEINAILNSKFPNPDLIIRTGGEYRLSNFLLWQSAYSELFFTNTLFPDLSHSELDIIYENFNK